MQGKACDNTKSISNSLNMYFLNTILGEIEADWLSDVGLGEWTQQWRQGKSLPENDIGPAVLKLSLKPHQVKYRVYSLNIGMY
jgi:hypothetical protein